MIYNARNEIAMEQGPEDMSYYEFCMPSLGADMEEGALLEWRVKAGDSIKRGQIIALVDTVKSTIEVECWVDGVVEELLYAPDSERQIKVGTALARLRVENETGEAVSASPDHTESGSARMPAVDDVSQEMNQSRAAGLQILNESHAANSASGLRIRISPAARKMIAEHKLDASTIKPGPTGIIQLADVEQFLQKSGPEARSSLLSATRPPGAGSRADAQDQIPASRLGERMERMRQAIAQAMLRSKKEIPHYYLKTEIDLTQALKRLAEWNTGKNPGQRILPIALFVRAVALATQEEKALNGVYEHEKFRAAEAAHIGLGIALRQGGLIAPALLDCQDKSPEQIMPELSDLVERARNLNLRGAEMTNATITITSLGDLGVEEVFGVIYPPQVAIVGFGSIMRKPIVKEDEIVIADTVVCTLSADHRASDGRQGALFLYRVKELLEEAEEL